MDEEKGTSLTRRELEAVIKRASELATTDPEGRSFTTSHVMETVGHTTGQEVQSRAVG